MPKLWKFLGKAEDRQIREYEFAAAEDLELSPEETELPEQPQETQPEPEPVDEKTDPIGYAQIQAEEILAQARKEAEQILAEAQESARETARLAGEKAAEEGYTEGFRQGQEHGTAAALEESQKAKAWMEAEFGNRVDAFSKSAERALTHQLSENMEGMRDLAIAVAEKVVSISLRSSADVIGKMIQTAVDKQKRREWVHIYIAQCDARELTSLPPALASALAELSDHVRIIPMANDEPGTCIVEFPDQIIDASASTQIQNIRELLNAGQKNL